MNIKHFKFGTYKQGYEYKYFVPSLINHTFSWNNSTINELLEKPLHYLLVFSKKQKFILSKSDKSFALKHKIFIENISNKRR